MCLALPRLCAASELEIKALIIDQPKQAHGTPGEGGRRLAWSVKAEVVDGPLGRVVATTSCCNKEARDDRYLAVRAGRLHIIWAECGRRLDMVKAEVVDGPLGRVVATTSCCNKEAQGDRYLAVRAGRLRIIWAWLLPLQEGPPQAAEEAADFEINEGQGSCIE